MKKIAIFVVSSLISFSAFAINKPKRGNFDYTSMLGNYIPVSCTLNGSPVPIEVLNESEKNDILNGALELELEKYHENKPNESLDIQLSFIRPAIYGYSLSNINGGRSRVSSCNLGNLLVFSDCETANEETYTTENGLFHYLETSHVLGLVKSVFYTVHLEVLDLNHFKYSVWIKSSGDRDSDRLQSCTYQRIQL